VTEKERSILDMEHKSNKTQNLPPSLQAEEEESLEAAN
jgi:hypothetical protein